MDQLISWLFILVLASICDGQWQRSSEDRSPPRDPSRRVHYHTKRHMLSGSDAKGSPEAKKQSRQGSSIKGNVLSPRAKVNYKPPGHLTPLKEDDIDNDEVMSVAIGPPPMRPYYDKFGWKPRSRNFSGSPNAFSTMKTPTTASQGAVTLVKDVLSQVAQEFLSHQVNEDFIFGQYIGHAIKNISKEYKLNFQHEILDLVIRYQNMSKSASVDVHPVSNPIEKKDALPTTTKNTPLPKATINDTEDVWPDFSNLANIVG